MSLNVSFYLARPLKFAGMIVVPDDDEIDQSTKERGAATIQVGPALAAQVAPTSAQSDHSSDTSTTKCNVEMRLAEVITIARDIVSAHRSAGTLPPFEVETTAGRSASVSGTDYSRFTALPSAQSIRHLFFELAHVSKPVLALFCTVTWGSKVLENTCPIDSFIVAVHRLFCDEPSLLKLLSDLRPTSEGARVLLDMHDMALFRQWEGARAVVVSYLLFSSYDYMQNTAQRWEGFAGDRLNLRCDCDHVPCLLQSVLTESCAVRHEFFITCDVPNCTHSQRQKATRKWSHHLPDRGPDDTLQSVLLRLLLPVPTQLPTDNVPGPTECHGMRSQTCTLLGPLPLLLMMTCNKPTDEHSLISWTPEHVPAVLDLSYTDAMGKRVEAVYDIYNLWCYDAFHFAGYFVFQSHDPLSPPEFVYNDCASAAVTVFASFIQQEDHRVLQLPRDYQICGMWYRKRH